MCTVVVSFAPGDPVPVLLVGVRDEFADRPWRPPGRHWPDLPVTGGLDLQAGGTWLAVNASAPRAACVLNGWGGAPVPASRRRSRGDLPLRAASDGLDAVRKLLADRATLERYDPFHLVVAELSSVTVLSWDGAELASTGLGPATHLYTNAGHAYPAPAPGPEALPGFARASEAPPGFARASEAPPGFARASEAPPEFARAPEAPPEFARAPLEPVPVPGAPPEPASASATAAGPSPSGPAAAERRRREPRAAYFGPRFAARRPSGDPRRPLADAWGVWLDLVTGDGLDATDPRALIVRRELPDGRIWGSSSISLVSLAKDRGDPVRYDFRALSGDAVRCDALPAAADFAWRTVLP